LIKLINFDEYDFLKPELYFNVKEDISKSNFLLPKDDEYLARIPHITNNHRYPRLYSENVNEKIPDKLRYSLSTLNTCNGEDNYHELAILLNRIA
jgi:hypothetical protein